MSGKRAPCSMLDCIERIPSLLKSILDTRKENCKALFDYLGEDGLNALSSIVLVGSGTSSTSGVTAAYFGSKVAGVPVRAAIPSEFCHNTYYYDPNALYVFISQTGTSKLTQRAMDLVMEKGMKALCISESPETKMAKVAPCFLSMGCGHEEYPMRTIGYSTSVFVMQLMALEIGLKKGAVTAEEYDTYIAEAAASIELLKPVPQAAMTWLQEKAQWALIRSQCLAFTGSAALYGVALESAVKAWETPKMTSVGLELEEGMHGANYGYDSKHAVIVFNDGGVDNHKALALASYMHEVHKNGWVIGPKVAADTDLQFDIAGENFCWMQFAAVGQVISYKLALDMGRDLPAPHDNSVMYSYFSTHSGW